MAWGNGKKKTSQNGMGMEKRVFPPFHMLYIVMKSNDFFKK